MDSLLTCATYKTCVEFVTHIMHKLAVTTCGCLLFCVYAVRLTSFANELCTLLGYRLVLWHMQLARLLTLVQPSRLSTLVVICMRV